MSNSKIFYFFSFLVLLSAVGTRCKKLVEVDAPPINLTNENVFKQHNTAIASVTGLYIRMGQTTFTGLNGISLYAGLSADELVNHIPSSDRDAYYHNDLFSNNSQSIGGEYWTSGYDFIFAVNSAIEGISESNTLSQVVQQQLLGELKFLRGYFYLYLVNLYGEVPLVLSTDWMNNVALNRSSLDEVYSQIIKDLQEASNLLSSEYMDERLSPYHAPEERVRPTRFAAHALLARAYLYAKDYASADREATVVISNSNFHLVPLNNVFLKNSAETIWQIQPVVFDHNTEEAFLFVLPENGPDFSHPVSLSMHLLESFESADERKNSWIDSIVVGSEKFFYAYKYKNSLIGNELTEYLTMLRLGEQYLIRAEARAYLGNIEGAQSDLNFIRNRAGLPNTDANDEVSLKSAILHERKVELFTENGHRWIDLKRSGVIDNVMQDLTPSKSASMTTWSSFKQYFPIPFSDISRAPNLMQNPGY